MKIILNKKIYTGKEVIDNGYIRFDETIVDLGCMGDYKAKEGDEIIEIEGEYLIPGFIDTHSHGGYGFDCMDASVEEIDEMVHLMAVREGITSYFCTTMTQSDENIENALVNIGKASKINPIIQGVHLEGPFINEKYKGAQNAIYIVPANIEKIERWNRACGNLIKVVTYAPEDASEEFEKWCEDHHIVLSIGHSDATYNQCMKSHGTRITHLYNAQRGMAHREPGVTGYGMLEEGIYTELIMDGLHIHPRMLKLAVDMRGHDHVELVTDSMRAKGMPDGESELGGQKVIVKDGAARLEDGTLAGSVLTFDRAYQNAMAFTESSRRQAVLMASLNQATEFKLEKKGSLEVGKDADILVMSQEDRLIQTISLGRLLKER